MIFKRRNRRSWSQAIRDAFAPRKGWRRSLTYIGRRVQRLPDTPHRIALGFACGVFASFTPFFTLHAFVAAGIAWAARGNIVASVLGTIVNNPLTIAPIAATSLALGNWMLGVENGATSLDGVGFQAMRERPEEAAELFWSLFTPYLVGGLAPGLAAAAVAYLLIKPIIARFQQRRRRILAERAQALLAARQARRAVGAGSPPDRGPDDHAGGGDGRAPAPPTRPGAGPGGAALRLASFGRRTAAP